jgi:two-component sensor histidine kinase
MSMGRDTLSIALIEDSDSDYELAIRLLRKEGLSFNPTRVTDRAELNAFLDGEEPDLVLADYNLPGYNGFDALCAVRAKWDDTPFIIISGSLSDEEIIELFKSGLDDFILKDRMVRLGQAIARVFEMREKKKALLSAQKEIIDLLGEKNMLLMELHDRVKNNLQIVLSIIRMEMDTISDAESRKKIAKIRDRIWGMALIHQEFYSVEKYSSVDFKVHVGKMFNKLSDFYQCGPDMVSLANNISCGLLTMKTAMPCAMIVQEFLSVVFDRSSSARTGGEVSFSLEMRDGLYVFFMCDDGKGLDEPYRKEHVSEISLAVIQQARSQLSGTFSFDFDHGICFECVFPRE